MKPELGGITGVRGWWRGERRGWREPLLETGTFIGRLPPCLVCANREEGGVETCQPNVR